MLLKISQNLLETPVPESLIFNFFKRETLAQVFSCECEIFKNILQTTTFVLRKVKNNYCISFFLFEFFFFFSVKRNSWCPCLLIKYLNNYYRCRSNHKQAFWKILKKYLFIELFQSFLKSHYSSNKILCQKVLSKP